MKRLLQGKRRMFMSWACTAWLLGMCDVVTLSSAEAQPQPTSLRDDSAIPQTVHEAEYSALITNSPFTRSLGISDSIILTGIAHIEGEVFATLLNTETLESQVVSKTANFQGWLLIGVTGDPAESRTWSAKIRVADGQIISVRYQKPPPKLVHTKPGSRGSSSTSGGNSPPLSSTQLDEAKNAAVNYKEGFNADGYPRQPPPEMVAKLSRLSVSQREDINRQMFGLRNQGLGLDERRKIYENLVDRSVQSRR